MIIQAEGLHKAYGRHEALRGLSVSVPEGSAYALIGANGAGKTTTIKLLMNILQPSRGTARAPRTSRGRRDGGQPSAGSQSANDR